MLLITQLTIIEIANLFKLVSLKNVQKRKKRV